MGATNYQNTDFHKTLDNVLDSFGFSDSNVSHRQDVVRYTRRNETSIGTEISIYSNSPCENTRKEQLVFLNANDTGSATIVRMQNNVITVGYSLSGRKDFSEQIDLTRINETSQNLDNFDVEKKTKQLLKAYFENAREFIQKGDFSKEACEIYLDVKPIYDGIFADIEGVFRIKSLFDDFNEETGEEVSNPEEKIAPITFEQAIADTAPEIQAIDSTQPYQSSLDGEDPDEALVSEVPAETKGKKFLKWLTEFK